VRRAARRGQGVRPRRPIANRIARFPFADRHEGSCKRARRKRHTECVRPFRRRASFRFTFQTACDLPPMFAANASLSRDFVFGARWRPSPCFPYSPDEGNGAPEAPGALRSAPWASLAIGRPSRRASGPKALRRWDSRARGPVEEPAPPGAPSGTRCRRRACSVIGRRDRRRLD